MALGFKDKVVLSPAQASRALARIAHEILERNGGTRDVIMVGVHTRGVPIARHLAAHIKHIEGDIVPVGSLDIGLYRDDVARGTRALIRPTEMPVDIEEQKVVLVDDVLFTGRTVRAAMDALTDFGRPREIQLAVMIDRGHRELPIRADYVGKNIPTSLRDKIKVLTLDTDGTDGVTLQRNIEE